MPSEWPPVGHGGRTRRDVSFHHGRSSSTCEVKKQITLPRLDPLHVRRPSVDEAPRSRPRPLGALRLLHPSHPNPCRHEVGTNEESNTSLRRWTSVVGPTETIVIGRRGQRSRTRRRSSRVTRAKASSSVGDGEVLAAVGPVEAERGEPAHRPLARGGRCGRGPCSWPGSARRRSSPSAIARPVDLGDPAEVGLGLAGLAAQEGEEGARLVVVLVRDLDAVGVAGVDQGPVEPRAGVVAEDRSPGAAAA